jgi:O-antigen/teichoic acid export membrane protein
MLLLARCLGRDDYGKVGFLHTTIITVGLIGGLGLGMTATRYVAESLGSNVSRVGELIRSILTLSLGTALIASALTVGIGSLVAMAVYRDTGLLVCFLLAGVAVFAESLQGVITGILAGFAHFGAVAMVQAIHGVSMLALCLFIVPGHGIVEALIAITAGGAISLAVSGLILERQCRNQCINLFLRPKRAGAAILWEFAAPGFGANLAMVCGHWLALSLLSHQGGFSDVAVVHMANQWRAAVLFVPVGVSTSMLPVLSRAFGANDHLGVKRTLRRTVHANLILALIPAGFISVFRRNLIGLYGEHLNDDSWTIELIVLSAVFAAVAHASCYGLMARNRMKEYLICHASYGICLLAGTWMGVGEYKGVAYGTSLLAASIVMCVLAFLLARTHADESRARRGNAATALQPTSVAMES